MSLSHEPEGAYEPRAAIHTTLFDLAAAVQDAAPPGDDALVVATLVHLLQTHRITYWGHPGVFETWRDEAAQHALPEFA